MTNLPPLFNIQRILPHIEANELILTPNNRLRSKILQAWQQYQQAQGTKVWETPRIEVIDQWFAQQWERLQAQAYPESAQVVASNEQLQVIWESITANCGLMQTSTVAKLAANAYTTLVRWNQPIGSILNKHSEFANTFNEQFIEWIKTFQDKLQTLNYITQDTCVQIVGEAFANDIIPKEHAIYLLGFDDLAPLFKNQLDKATNEVMSLPASDYQPQSVQRIHCNDNEHEMLMAAQWARHIVEQHKNVRIGIISPNLGQCRQQIEFAFTSVFEAYSLHPSTERYTLPFNVSAGTPLGDTPLISATLQLLTLQQKEFDIETVVQILLSPFWGHYQQQLERRCELANKLQSLGVFTISGENLRYWAQRIDDKYNAQTQPHNGELGNYELFTALNNFHAILNHTASSPRKNQQLPSSWVDLFLQQLKVLHWPGERTPDSQEYQQTQLWYQLLETFASLDNILGVINQHTALQQLQKMAKHMPFQPKVPDSPIQILGILEGAGLHFTHCWIMGLHQQVWPPAPAPNSLIPIRLQREYNMPHASSLRELHYAQSLTDNYRHCADTVIFSSPNNEDDSDQHLLPSQLINDIPLVELTTQTAIDSLMQWQKDISDSALLELINCTQGPAFTHTSLPGGSSLFKNQAENAFDSFAKYQLGAQTPIEAMNGFSHIERGNILHNTLAALWREIKTQQVLLETSDNDIFEHIDHHLQIAIRDVQKHKPQHLSNTLCDIEKDRQKQLIFSWMQYEKTRTPFTVVAIEEAQTISFNDRTINIRIDRVDQLHDGSYLIIDYKTGAANINAWKGERPKEPQLPLYALTYGSQTEKIKGISFAQININDQTFKGLAEADLSTGIISIEKNRIELPNTWEATLAHWHDTLEKLLNEFTQGICHIQYLDEATKTYAREMLKLNRFHEAEAIQKQRENNDS